MELLASHPGEGLVQWGSDKTIPRLRLEWPLLPGKERLGSVRIVGQRLENGTSGWPSERLVLWGRRGGGCGAFQVCVCTGGKCPAVGALQLALKEASAWPTLSRQARVRTEDSRDGGSKACAHILLLILSCA